MIDEKLAKEELEDEVGIYFKYTRARYDDATKVWVFTIANKDGRRVLRASHKEDFAPYITLSRHLKLDFEDFIANYVWIYGDEIEIAPNEEINQYCLTNKGWLALSDIVKAFIEKFGEYSKDNLLKNVTWKLVIDKNECSSSTYKKNEKPGWPNVNTRVSLDFNELEEKIINCEEEKSKEQEEIQDDVMSKAQIQNIVQEKSIESSVLKEFKIEKTATTESDVTRTESPETTIDESNIPKITSQNPEISTNNIVEPSVPDIVHPKTPKHCNLLSSFGKKIDALKKDAEDCIVHFDANGGECNIEDVTVPIGSSFVLPKSDSVNTEGAFLLYREGSFLLCFSTDAKMDDTYEPGSFFQLPKNRRTITLYAIWAHPMFVSSSFLKITESPLFTAQDVLRVPVLATPKQCDEVLVIEDSNIGVQTKVVFLAEDESSVCIGFADARSLRRFAITNILIGNMGTEKEYATPSTAPNLYASDIAYLWVQAEISCRDETVGSQKFFIKIIDDEGMLRASDLSPSGYTDSIEMQIEADEKPCTYNMIAWGSAVQGEAYKGGNYTVEIWHANDELKDDKPSCIASKTFTLKIFFPN